MGRLRTLTTLLILGAGGVATDGATPGAAPSAAPANRPPAPVPPVKYLEAGARLFNNGQYALAGKYLGAAQTYRDQLTVSQQTVLDAYLKEMTRIPTDGDVAAAATTPPPQAQAQPSAPASAPPTDPTPPASAPAPPAAPVGLPPSAPPAVATPPSAPPAPAPAQAPQAAVLPSSGTDPRATSTDTKQTARWMLQSAREQIALGNYDEADKLVSQARGMNIKWGLFDDTPTKVSEALEKARPKGVAATRDVSQPHTRAAASAKLKEARALLASNQYDQAEVLANDVKSWGLSYGMFGDSPDKVAAAARAVRRRDAIRQGKSKDQPSQGVYEVLVQESRQLMSKGQYDQAEAKARQAQRMNVVPALTADRAESVLHDIAMARASHPTTAPATAVASLPAAPAAEPASALAERDANSLVAKGDTEGAATKFSEVERLRAEESGGTAPPSPTDPAVQRVEGEAPAIGLNEPPTGMPEALAPPPPVTRAEQLLAEARTLYSSGNYPAARQTAVDAKAAGDVDTQADDLIAQIALAEQGGVLSLYESALDAVRKGDNARARALLAEVTASGGADESLQRKAQDLLAKLPTEGNGRATATDLPQAMDAESLAAQKLNAEVGTKIAEARRLQEIDPEKAIGIYEQTLKGVKAAEIPESARRTMARRLEVAIELARKDKVTFEAKMRDKAFKAEIENKRLRILEADQAKKARFKDLMDKAMGAYAEGKYNEAEAYAMRAGEIDPNDVTPPALVYKSRYERRFKRDNEIKALKEDGAVVAFQEADAASIADPEVQMRGIRYPKDFKDLTRERRRMNAMLEPKRDPKTLAIEAKLKDQVSLNIKDQPLAEAMGFLANYTGLNIILDPKAMAEVDITSSTPVNLVTTTPISLKAALKLMLQPLGLNYRVDDEVLLITSPQSMQKDTYAQTYYVGDLILSPTQLDPKNPLDSVNPTARHRSANPMQAMQTMSSANGATSVVNDGATARVAERPNIDMTPLIQLITASIAPGTWKVHDPSGADVSSAYGMGGGFAGADAGGLDTATPIGSITPFFLSISLIIRHTAEIHDQIADLLRQLRRLQDLQVSIEVRFITLNDSFFEQIGVDFDFDIHSKTVGKKSTFAIPNPSQSLFPIGGVLGGTSNTTGGNTANTGGIGATSGGGLGGSSGTGAIGGGGGSTGALGGSGGGLGGIAGGTTSGGATAGGTTGGTGGVGNNPVYIVNPFRDYSLGNKLPITVGTNGPGIGNFTSDLVVPFQQGPYQSLIAPSNATTSNAGATFGISFLSDLEVYLFLSAAQGDTRTNVLQAPKVTTFNGAPALLTNVQAINYVAELLPIVGPGSVAFFPSVSTFPNGVTLNVTPVVSADRRYVRMTLSPTFTVLNNFDTISVPAAVGGSGLGGSGAPISGTIQLPNFSLTTISTTVTVPDGGTVLMGGVKRLSEERKEFGVPVLSKTPLLNRLFRNIGIGRTTSSLMMMVTPRIIILEEEEERLGIPTVVQ